MCVYIYIYMNTVNEEHRKLKNKWYLLMTLKR